MSIEKVKEFLKKYNKDNAVIELVKSSATVELAASALGGYTCKNSQNIIF